MFVKPFYNLFYLPVFSAKQKPPEVGVKSQGAPNIYSIIAFYLSKIELMQLD